MSALGLALLTLGVMMVWAGITQPTGGLIGAVEDVLSGRRAPGKTPATATQAAQPAPGPTQPLQPSDAFPVPGGGH